MTGWLLILVIVGSLQHPASEATDAKQFGPFADKAACEQAGEKILIYFSRQWDTTKKPMVPIPFTTQTFCVRQSSKATTTSGPRHTDYWGKTCVYDTHLVNGERIFACWYPPKD